MIRVAQIIDSLHAGGAERIAVNYANALSKEKVYSALVTTRQEGTLKTQILHPENYLFLQKKSTVDFKAILNLRNFVLQNKISILHVHGSSFFIAFLVKLLCWKLQLLYHEHNGERIKQSFWKNMPLFFCLLFFSKIIVVNKQLLQWYQNYGYKSVSYFPNFGTLEDASNEKTILHGKDKKRIVCLANLRNPKNHILLLETFANIVAKFPEWTLHLIGKNKEDSYYANLLAKIEELHLENSVFFYGARNDIGCILEQSSIGVLCSTYEGFPVTLLEYGLAGLPVVCSDVGYCSDIIMHQKTGLLFPSNNAKSFTEQLEKLIASEQERIKYSQELLNHVETNFSSQKVVLQLLELYQNI